MSESTFEAVARCSKTLKLDFCAEEFAYMAQEHSWTPETVNAVADVFQHLSTRKAEMTIQTLLRLSRLPLKDPKTFENFDFSVIKGRDVERPKALPSLSAIYAHRNLAFIGPTALERHIWHRRLALNAANAA